MKHRPLKLREVVSAVGLVCLGCVLQYPALQALAWGVAHPTVVAIGAFLLMLAALAWLAVRPPKQPEGWDR